jgi:hypothetical protein
MPKHSTTPNRPHFDRPEVSEILVDALRGVDVNGGVLRFEFVVNRFNEPKNDKSEGSRTYTACRLALPIVGVLDLFDKLEGLVNTLERTGLIQKNRGAMSPSSSTFQ